MTKIDCELIASLMLEINDRIKLIEKIFPRDKEFLIKHLAATAVHLALFAKDLFNHQSGDNLDIKPEYEKRFLDECGCKDVNI